MFIDAPWNQTLEDVFADQVRRGRPNGLPVRTTLPKSTMSVRSFSHSGPWRPEFGPDRISNPSPPTNYLASHPLHSLHPRPVRFVARHHLHIGDEWLHPRRNDDHRPHHVHVLVFEDVAV